MSDESWRIITSDPCNATRWLERIGRGSQQECDWACDCTRAGNRTYGHPSTMGSQWC